MCHVSKKVWKQCFSIFPNQRLRRVNDNAVGSKKNNVILWGNLLTHLGGVHVLTGYREDHWASNRKRFEKRTPEIIFFTETTRGRRSQRWAQVTKLSWHFGLEFLKGGRKVVRSGWCGRGRGAGGGDVRETRRSSLSKECARQARTCQNGDGNTGIWHGRVFTHAPVITRQPNTDGWG